jgi:hypothetical protein
MDQQQAQRAISQVLLDHVARDTYPSVTQMNLLEQSITPDLVDDYVAVLLSKVDDDRWPSLDIIRRLQRIANALPQAG